MIQTPIQTEATLLIVDDEEPLRMLLSEIMEMLGYRTLQASDGPSALHLLETRNVDLLVSDIGLPGPMNGRQMADAARTQHPQLPVLFITGYAEDAAATGGRLSSGTHIMAKPFMIDAFAAKVRQLLDEPPLPVSH